MDSDRHALEDEIISRAKESVDIQDSLYRYVEKIDAIPYTKNNNGIYLNLSTVSIDILKELIRHIQECPERYINRIIQKTPTPPPIYNKSEKLPLKQWKPSAFQKRLVNLMNDMY